MNTLKAEDIEVQWDNVLIRQDEMIQQTQSGIVIAGSARKEDNSVLRGTVIGVGPGRTDPFGVYREQEYQPGDQVLYPQHWTRSFVLGSETYDILSQDRIHGKVKCQ